MEVAHKHKQCRMFDTKANHKTVRLKRIRAILVQPLSLAGVGVEMLKLRPTAAQLFKLDRFETPKTIV